MAPDDERLKRLLEAIFSVHQTETIDCDTCADQFDCLVDLVNRGVKLRDLLPAVEEHLRCCPDCNEEFLALVAILREETRGSSASLS
jgi:hypothetical protein